MFDVAAANLMHLHVVDPGDSRDVEYDAFCWPGHHIPDPVSSNLDGLISISWERLEVCRWRRCPNRIWHRCGALAGSLARW